MGAKESNIKLQEIKHEMKHIKKEINELNELNKNETDEKYFEENENNINNLKNKYDELKKIYKGLKKGETLNEENNQKLNEDKENKEKCENKENINQDDNKLNYQNKLKEIYDNNNEDEDVINPTIIHIISNKSNKLNHSETIKNENCIYFHRNNNHNKNLTNLNPNERFETETAKNPNYYFNNIYNDENNKHAKN